MTNQWIGPLEVVEWIAQVEEKELEPTGRGTGGFGSTGN